ncbi:MAG: nickel-dependent hydrogenase large subunit [Candidatus Desulforudis sp.]|nr:nickel-dependent hydrogenase large subunit [Desulforudis sp.]
MTTDKNAGTRIVINPTTRTMGASQVEVRVKAGRVVDARCGATVFRGFELILRDRDPRDAAYITQRICGICPTAHATAASFAVEDLAGIRPPHNGNLLRNLIFAGDLLQNHIRHFYLFTVPDYVRVPEIRPLTPPSTTDCRLPRAENQRLIDNYFQSIDVSRKAYEIDALLGGKAPHPHGILPGGGSVPVTAITVLNLLSIVKTIYRFIEERMLPDVYTLAEHYPEYFEIGARGVDFLNFGLFPVDPEASAHHFPGAAMIGGRKEAVDSGEISEHLRYTHFEGAPVEHPSRGDTRPNPDKPGGYSWAKAPRYRGRALEGGPLAQLWTCGDYRRGVSVLDRLIARVLLSREVAGLMRKWLTALKPGRPVFSHFQVPKSGVGVGLTGAMRGPLGHWLEVEGGRIKHYQIITPTAWNFSPHDDQGGPGPVEEALIGTPVADPNEPVEIGRVLHSFDPCMSCVAHVIVVDRPVPDRVIVF